MTRLQKKCFFASAASHGLLCAIILVGPAFLSRRLNVENLPVIEMIPTKIVDDALFGGGNPNIKQPTAPRIDPTAPLPQAQPQPVQPTPPTKPEKIEEPAPTPPETRTTRIEKPSRTTSKAPASAPDTPANPLDRVKVDLSRRVNRDSAKGSTPAQTTAKKSAADSDRENQRRAAAAAGAQLNRSLQTLRSGLSGGTTIELPGPGGEFYANWAQVVKSIYERAWTQPEDLDTSGATVEVEVTINRDGSIARATTRVTRRSGLAPLDKSVQRALDGVDKVPPFPQGAKESQRTLNILFKLKSNRSIG